MKKELGSSVIETLVVLLVFGVLAAIAVSAMDRVLEQSSARSLVTRFTTLVNRAKTMAVVDRIYAGISFKDTPNGVEARIYKDGDNDGLSNEDLHRGVDSPIDDPVILKDGMAWVGLPSYIRSDPEGYPLTGDNAVRFGRGRLLSFSPTATATPGSLYVECGSKEVWAFRVAGIGGRVRVFCWRNGFWTEIERE